MLLRAQGFSAVDVQGRSQTAPGGTRSSVMLPQCSESPRPQKGIGGRMGGRESSWLKATGCPRTGAEAGWGPPSGGAGPALRDTEHAVSGPASSAAASHPRGAGLSHGGSGGLQPPRGTRRIGTTLSEAAKQREGRREGGRNVRACKASHCGSRSCREEGMRCRQPREAGNQGRGTVIESICWKGGMRLVAGSRRREKAHAGGTAQSHGNLLEQAEG